MPTFTCPGCNRPLDVPLEQVGFFVSCPSCGTTFAAIEDQPVDRPEWDYEPLPTRSPASLEAWQIWGLAGAGCLFFGVFAPLFSVPIIGHFNYLANGRGDGVLVLLLSLLAAFLVMLRAGALLLLPGIGSLLIMLCTLTVFQGKIGDRELNPAVVQMDWGWAVLFVGVLLTLTAAIMSMAKRH